MTYFYIKMLVAKQGKRELREETGTFPLYSKHKKADMYLSQMLDNEFVSCFLCNIFHYFKALNLGLHWRDKTVVDLIEKITMFQKK